MLYEMLNEGHLSELAKIYVDTYNAPPWNDKWTVESATARLLQMLNSTESYGLVCVDEDLSVIGMIWGYREIYYDCVEFLIRDFLVALPLQGKGIGSIILHEFEQSLKKQGINQAYLFTSRNEKTESFYAKRGYNSWNGMIMMGKELDE